jgi:hypothetical protein
LEKRGEDLHSHREERDEASRRALAVKPSCAFYIFCEDLWVVDAGVQCGDTGRGGSDKPVPGEKNFNSLDQLASGALGRNAIVIEKKCPLSSFLLPAGTG